MPEISVKGQVAPESVDLSAPKVEPAQGESALEQIPLGGRLPASKKSTEPEVVVPKVVEAAKPKETEKPLEIPKAVESPKPTEPAKENLASQTEITPILNARVPVEVVNEQKDIPARTVFVDLEPVEGASTYEIQVVAKSQHWGEPYKFEIQTSHVRFRLTPGSYALRARSKEADGRPGYWGEWKDFWIHFQSPNGVYPGPNAEIVPKGSAAERVVFEWPKIKRAKAYNLRLFDQSGELIRNIRTINTWQPIDLELNKTYAWSVQPLTRMDEPDRSITKKDLVEFHVGISQKELRGIAVDVPAVKRAVRYQYEFVRFLEDDKTSEPTIYASREPIFRARLEPGEYEMRVRSEFEDGSLSDWSSPNRFWIPAATPKMVSPIAGRLIDPDDDVEATVEFKWEKTLNAKRYRVKVWDENDQLITTTVTDQTSVILGMPHNKKYRWNVVGLLDREKERGPAAEAAPAKELTREFSIDQYVKLSLSQAEEPSQLYAWGRYLASIMSYQSSNYDNNTALTQQIFGGTGEIAAGYWHRKTNYGLLTTAALSGFTTRNLTYTYSHASILAGYRRIQDGPVRWRVWFGPAYHQTPEVLVDFASERIYFGRIESMGPEFRAIYMRDFWDRYGAQVYFSVYRGIAALSTPNRRAMKEAMLYNFGAFGTYRINSQMVGLLGYSYQVEEGKYQSQDAFTNGINSFSFSGHFISATLQIGLEKPRR